MINPVKVGEGAYGEVFRCTICANELNVDVVLKIIPIEGSIEINGEKQKSFAEILPEIIITKKMSSLQACENNCTIGFVNIHKVKVWVVIIIRYVCTYVQQYCTYVNF